MIQTIKNIGINHYKDGHTKKRLFNNQLEA